MNSIDFEITSRNALLLGDFYSKLFGWNIAAPDAEGISTIEGANGISARLFQPPEKLPSSLVVYIPVENVEASLEQAKALGGEIIFGPLKQPDGSTIGLFADPEGIMIGLSQRA